MKFNPYSLPLAQLFNPLVVCALLITMTSLASSIILLILGKEKKHRLWSLFNLSVGSWALCVAVATSAKNPSVAYNFWRASHIAGIYVSITFFHFVCLYSQLNRSRIIAFAYLYGIVHNIVNYTPLLYNGVNYLFDSIFYLSVKKVIFLAFLLPWVTLALVGNYELFKSYLSININQRHEARLIFVISSVGFLGGSTIFLPMLGINFYPVAIILTAVHATTATYMIFRHQFLELKFIVQKSIVYSLLITFITIFYLLIVFMAERSFRGALGYNSPIVSTFAVLIIAIIITPIKNKIQYFVDRIFFKGTQFEIAQQNELLKQEVARSERLKTVAILASGLAHEIKNPLTALKTFSEYLPEKKNDPEFLNKFSKIVGREVDRIDNLVHQLLNFAKPTPLTLKKTDIHQLIDDTLNFLNSKFIQQNIKVVKNFDSTREPVLEADSNQLKQALLNIFLNAIEAMNNGGTLTVKTRIIGSGGQRNKGASSLNPKILNPSNPTLEISISDTGYGIDKKDLLHIFDPFFSKKDGGTGLGLAITHEIIKKHSGTIKVSSKVDSGTEFVIELPIS